MGNKEELTVMHGVPFIPPWGQIIGIVGEPPSATLSSLRDLQAACKYIVNRPRNMGNKGELTVMNGVPLIPPWGQSIGIVGEPPGTALSSLSIHGKVCKYIVNKPRNMGNEAELTMIHEVPIIPSLMKSIETNLEGTTI